MLQRLRTTNDKHEITVMKHFQKKVVETLKYQPLPLFSRGKKPFPGFIRLHLKSQKELKEVAMQKAKAYTTREFSEVFGKEISYLS